jgi:hypothetical protein
MFMLKNLNRFLFIFCYLGVSLTIRGQISFAPVDSVDHTSVNEQSTYLGGNAYAVDFNKDGLDDIVYMNGNSLFIKLNTGVNSFGESLRIYQDAHHIYSISNFTDINNDSYPDLAITTTKGITVLVSSNGMLQKAFDSQEAIYYGKVILEDFNKDGKPDLAATYYNTIAIFNNVGLGLSSKSIIYTANYPVFNFELKDLNNDSYLDLVLVGFEKIEILFGKSDNTFVSVFSKVTTSLSAIEIGDLNLDGFQDVVYFSTNDPSAFTLIYDNALNKFTEQAIFSSNSIPENVFSFKLIDIKGNGKLDLVYNNFFDLVFKENNGSGQFLSQVSLKPNTFAPLNYSLINFDGDNLPDLLQCDNGRFEVVTFKANGTVNKVIADGYLNQTWDILYDDVDDDGFQDILTVNRSGSFQIRWGNAANDYSTYSTFKIPLDCFYGSLFDVNQDGFKDVIVTKESSNNSINSMLLLEGLGDRQFKEYRDWKYFPNPSKPFIDDLNNDDSKDVFVFERFGNKIFWPDPNDQDYNEYFTTNRMITLSGSGLIGIAHEDVNKDGYVDLITANLFSKDVSVLMNNKLGNFSEMIITPNGTVAGVLGVAAYDYNHDSYMDVLVTVDLGNNVGALQVFLNDQVGAFVYSSSSSFENNQAQNLHILDIDGDNDLDIIVSGWDFATSTVFLDENGTIENIGNDIIQNVGQSSRIYRDINADGKPDVFSANFHGGSIFIQLNNSVREPLLVESEITIELVDLKSAKFKFSSTSADGRLVMITKTIEPTTVPVDNFFYVSNPQVGLGSNIGTNSYVVRVGNQETLEVTGLSTATKYTISVFEYNANAPQLNIINYTSEKVEKSFTTLNSPPQVAAVPSQSGFDLKPLEIPLDIQDEDNLIGELQFNITSSNEAVIPKANVTVINKGTSLALKLQPIDYGEALIELTVIDTAQNASKVTIQYMSIVTGIEARNVISLSVFPNPFKTVVSIIETDRDRELKIFNMEGQMIERFEKIPESVDLTGKPEGLYLFKTSDGKYTKVVKN